MPEFDDKSANNVLVVDFERGLAKAKEGGNRALNEKKRHLFQTWIAKGTVSVFLDSRIKGVKVPESFMGCPELILNFSYDFHIPDFNFNDVGVWATLSFDEGEFFCIVPWHSVLGMQSAVLLKAARWFVDFEASEQSEKKPASSQAAKAKVIEIDFNSKKTI